MDSQAMVPEHVTSDVLFDKSTGTFGFRDMNFVPNETDGIDDLITKYDVFNSDRGTEFCGHLDIYRHGIGNMVYSEWFYDEKEKKSFVMRAKRSLDGKPVSNVDIASIVYDLHKNNARKPRNTWNILSERKTPLRVSDDQIENLENFAKHRLQP